MRPPSQYKKFRNIFEKLISDINSDQGSSIEIIDEIKKELKKELPSIYEEWENSGFDVNFKFKLQIPAINITETTLLHLAVLEQSIPCTSVIRYLLNTGANPNLQDSDNKTPLYMAAVTSGDKNKEIVKLLLERGADPNIAESYGQTPLHVACTFCGDEGFNVETIKLLLKSGADINKEDNKRNTPLHQLIDTSIGISENSTAYLEEQSLELVKLFVEHGASIYTKNKSHKTPKGLIELQRLSTFPMNRKLACSIEQFLEEQESSREYHGKLLELLEQTKDLKFLTEMITENGVMSVKGIQICSQAIPKILGISGIEIAVKGTIVEGEIEKGFSHGTGWPVVDVEGNPLKYHDLFNRLVSFFEKNSVIKNLQRPKPELLGWKVPNYVISNLEAIKQEFWGDEIVDSIPEAEKEEDNVTARHVVQKEPDKKNQDTVKHHGKKKTGGDSDSKEKREKAASEKTVMGHPPINSGVYSQKEPPIFSRKQKIAIAVGIVAALATALVCYSVQLPILAIVVSALIVGAGAYMVSSKLYDISICSGASQQPGL
ncbi:ankyrin repeat domain-containing protein [Wolbachia endosymbiont of Cantharis cryptica]|uniref:ankyrin repeat domain-containing protein n=1 Tax=Wolbachia endosymbiont of Cantharis cryptica TaxID=3066132 RepID=UPI00376EA917